MIGCMLFTVTFDISLFHSKREVTIVGKERQNVGQCWALTAFEQGGMPATGTCFIHGPPLLIKQGTSLEIAHPSLRWLIFL